MPTKKSAAQLTREINEALGGKYIMAADRLGERPKSFPKRLRHGLYTATFKGIDERFPGDKLASARWTITRRGKEVGTMHEGSAYGWGRPTSTMRQLVWGGTLPPGASDSRTAEYGISFDQQPAASHAEALANFARAADRLIEWRRQHEQAGKEKRAKKAHSTIRQGDELKPTALSAEQLEALRTFAKANGRAWKSKLNDEWMTGRYAVYNGTDDYGSLQQIRNRFGPTWLARFAFDRSETRTRPARSHSTIATRDYEYVVYPEATHRHADRAVKIPMRRVGGSLRPYDLTAAKLEAKRMGAPAAIYSVSKGRFVGYVHPSGRYVTFR